MAPDLRDGVFTDLEPLRRRPRYLARFATNFVILVLVKVAAPVSYSGTVSIKRIHAATPNIIVVDVSGLSPITAHNSDHLGSHQNH